MKINDSWFLSFQLHSHISCLLNRVIITEELGYQKLCVRWLPKMLTDIHKQQCMEEEYKFLQRFKNNEQVFFTNSSEMKHGFPTWTTNHLCSGTAPFIVSKNQNVQTSTFYKKNEGYDFLRQKACRIFWTSHNWTVSQLILMHTTKTLDIKTCHSEQKT